MPAPSLVPPRYVRPSRSRNDAEKHSWLFMRYSGALLMVLIFTHLFVNLYTGDGINAIDFAFVAGKWASPLWKVWDLVMLWLAMIHGTNGMRMLVNDYATGKLRMALQYLLGAALVTTLVLGTLVIFTFDPCPVGADASLLPSFCANLP